MDYFRYKTLGKVNQMTQTPHPIIFAGRRPRRPGTDNSQRNESLQKADLIVYAGSLVPKALLCWKNDDATAISSAGMDLDQIIKTMSDAAQSRKSVVRLHTGDPSLYGAILEQMKALDALGIPYKIIPGVTAAFAAAAAIQMEYTLPEVTQTLILTRMAGGPRYRRLKIWTAWQPISLQWPFT